MGGGFEWIALVNPQFVNPAVKITHVVFASDTERSVKEYLVGDLLIADLASVKI